MYSTLPLKIESTSPSFAGPEAFKLTVHPSTGDDLTVKALATPLEPATTYYFRWRHGSAISPVGSFETAPSPDDPADVRFAYTADSDGLQLTFFGNDFPVLDAVRAESPDFWIYLGDTIDSDSSLRTAAGLSPAALTVGEYRDAYEFNRSIGALPDLMQSTSTYAVWDDHEVRNDYSGQTVDPARYANGRKAFVEYMLIDRFAAPTPISKEFVTGPIATFTFQEEVASFAAGLGLPPATVIGAFHQVLSLVGVLCRNIDIDAYALVEVDAGAGTATLSFKDENGALVTNSNPLAPFDTSACTATIGP